MSFFTSHWWCAVTFAIRKSKNGEELTREELQRLLEAECRDWLRWRGFSN